MSVPIPRGWTDESKYATGLVINPISLTKPGWKQPVKKFSVEDESSVKPVRCFLLADKLGETSLPYSIDLEDYRIALGKNNLVLLPLWYSMKTLGTNNDHVLHSKIDVTLKRKPRDDKQAEQLSETMSSLLTNRTATLKLRPGSGKTALSLFAMSQLGLLTCVIFSLGKLSSQWKSALEKFTSGTSWVVGDEDMPSQVDLIICPQTRVMKIPEYLRTRVGFLIIDEAHKMNTKTGVEGMLRFHPKFILTLTGTFHRSADQMHRVMEHISGSHMIVSPYDITFSVVKHLTGIKAVREANTGGRNGPKWHVLNNSLVMNENRNEMIRVLVNKRHLEGRKNLLVTTYVKHRTMLYSMIKADGRVTVDYLSDKKKEFTDSDVLVVNVQIGGTGLDEETGCVNWKGKRFDNVIICGSFRNPELMEQVLGRVLRSKDPNVDYLVDDDATIASQFSDAANLFKSLGAKSVTTSADISKIVLSK